MQASRKLGGRGAPWYPGVMPTALVFSVPAVGHVHPTLPIVAELVRRGTRVVYYCGEEMRPKIEATGAEFRRIAWEYGHLFAARLSSVTQLALEQVRSVEAWMPELLLEIARLGPDYILNDFMALWGRVAARALGLPLVTFCSSFALGKDVLPPAALMTALDVGISPRRAAMLRALRRESARLSRRYPIRPMKTPLGMFAMDGDLVLVATSRSFQPKSEDYDDRFQFVGPCFAPRAGDAATGLPPLDDRPLVYVSLGTVFNRDTAFFERCARAFEDGRYQVIMSVGKHGQYVSAAARHPHIHAMPYVPQLEVLSRAALFITHGGMNSTAEGICNEVPLLVAPQGADQFVVARRIEETGVGRKLSFWHRSPKRLRALVDEVVGDQQIRVRARELHRSFVEAGGPMRAADVLQSIGRG